MFGSSWWTLFNPRTLYGIIEYIHSSPFSDSDFDPKFIMTQWTFFALCNSLAIVAATKLKRISPILITLVSPFTIGTCVDTLPATKAIEQFLENCKRYRSTAAPIAVSVLRERIRSGRAVRNQNFDLYLPQYDAGDQIGHNVKNPSQCGLIFLPGAYVDHSSYAPVAALLSDEGICVAVVSAEPWRISTKWLGNDLGTISSIARRSSRELKKKIKPGALHPKIKWHLGGHSLGGYTAMDTMHQILEQKKNSIEKQKQNLFANSRLVVWGAGSFPQIIPQFHAHPELKCLFIFGENDVMAKPTGDCFNSIRSRLPEAQITFQTIPGGNHNGFAAYPSDPKFSGVQGILLEEQHRLTASYSSKFLL